MDFIGHLQVAKAINGPRAPSDTTSMGRVATSPEMARDWGSLCYAIPRRGYCCNALCSSPLGSGLQPEPSPLADPAPSTTFTKARPLASEPHGDCARDGDCPRGEQCALGRCIGSAPASSFSASPTTPAARDCFGKGPCPPGFHCYGLPLNRCVGDHEKNLPKCLPGDTWIATPSGPVRVRDLAPPARVWTLDASGARVVAEVLSSTRVRVPTDHVMKHVVFDDDREVLASPGHPTCALGARGGEARTVADLRKGERAGDVDVRSSEDVPYDGTETFDILPAGETGCYWANGVLLGSTLGPRSTCAPPQP